MCWSVMVVYRVVAHGAATFASTGRSRVGRCWEDHMLLLLISCITLWPCNLVPTVCLCCIVHVLALGVGFGPAIVWPFSACDTSLQCAQTRRPCSYQRHGDAWAVPVAGDGEGACMQSTNPKLWDRHTPPWVVYAWWYNKTTSCCSVRPGWVGNLMHNNTCTLQIIIRVVVVISCATQITIQSTQHRCWR